MTNIKEFNLLDVRKNSKIISCLTEVYKLWGYEEVSPSTINNIETIKASEVINQKELIGLSSNSNLCLRPEMTTSIIKLISTRLINKKRPLRLWNSGTTFERIEGYKNSEKLKERIHSGIELIGYETEFPEIEIINLLFDAIDKFELKKESKLVFLVSSTTLMDLILKTHIAENYEIIKKCIINMDQDSINKLEIKNSDKLVLKDLLFTRGEPFSIINKLQKLYGEHKTLEDLSYLFQIICPIAKNNGIEVQLDPTFQPHLNLYAGIVFQLICIKDNKKLVIAKGGRYDELVRYFNPKEKVPTGLGFSISIDNIRKLIKDDPDKNNKVLIAYKIKSKLAKAIIYQKELHAQGITAILEINPCVDNQQADYLMKVNNCSNIIWID